MDNILIGFRMKYAVILEMLPCPYRHVTVVKTKGYLRIFRNYEWKNKKYIKTVKKSVNHHLTRSGLYVLNVNLEYHVSTYSCNIIIKYNTCKFR